MIKVSSNKFEIKVSFEIRSSLGRTSSADILIPRGHFADESPSINIPATGSMALVSIPEFIKAIELAAMIANGELEAAGIR